jgi:uncharacterized membrane protein
MTLLPRSWPKRIGLFLLAAFFVYAGVSHFTQPASFEAIVPSWLPAPLLLVYVSGVCEILGGLGALLPVTRSLAGYGLVALLIAVFPANVQMAIDADRWLAQGVPTWALYVRLPLQLLLVAWAWWATRPDTTVAAAEPAV